MKNDKKMLVSVNVIGRWFACENLLVIGLEENIHCTAIWWSTRFWKLNGHKCFWLPRNIIMLGTLIHGCSFSPKKKDTFLHLFSVLFYTLYINLNVVLSRTHLTTRFYLENVR